MVEIPYRMLRFNSLRFDKQKLSSYFMQSTLLATTGKVRWESREVGKIASRIYNASKKGSMQEVFASWEGGRASWRMWQCRPVKERSEFKFTHTHVCIISFDVAPSDSILIFRHLVPSIDKHKPLKKRLKGLKTWVRKVQTEGYRHSNKIPRGAPTSCSDSLQLKGKN